MVLTKTGLRAPVFGVFCMTKQVDLHDVPAPDSPQALAERQRKHVATVVLHNPRCDTDTIRALYRRRYPDAEFSDRLKAAMREGWIRRGKHGWVPTDAVQ